MEHVKELVSRIEPTVVEVRHHLHAHPELSGQEYETSKYIQGYLQQAGIPFEVIDGRSIVATVTGRTKGKTLVIRGDFDALPIQEENDLPYKSQNPGVMHACGHDCNAAMLLGTGLVLQQMRDQFDGTVKLLFQEAEEKAAGALIALQSGLLDGADNSLSIHLLPDRDVGKFITRRGIFNAYCLKVDISIKGKGGHPAHPDYTVNPIFIGMNVVNTINSMLAYEVDPYDTVVASVLYFNAGRKGGSIPGECEIGLVFKFLDQKYDSPLREKISEIVESYSKASCGCGSVEYSTSCPPMINEDASYERAVRVVSELYGEDALLITKPEFFGDDYAYIMEKYPGMMMNIGMAGDGHYTVGHNPNYLVDDRCLGYGLNFMVHYCLDYFGAEGPDAKR